MLFVWKSFMKLKKKKKNIEIIWIKWVAAKTEIWKCSFFFTRTGHFHWMKHFIFFCNFNFIVFIERTFHFIFFFYLHFTRAKNWIFQWKKWSFKHLFIEKKIDGSMANYPKWTFVGLKWKRICIAKQWIVYQFLIKTKPYQNSNRF